MKMILLEELPVFESESLAKALNDDWGYEFKASEIDASGTAIAFEIEGEMFGLMIMDIKIPESELQNACEYALHWPDAAKQVKRHKAHLIPTIMTANGSMKHRMTLLTKLTATLVKLTKSIGVYVGIQQIMVQAETYVEEAERIKDGLVPVGNWVLIGMGNDDGKMSAFTIGLNAFDYKEFEIIKSKAKAEDIYAVLYNLVEYVVGNDVKLKNGETFGSTKDQKFKIKLTSSEIFTGEKVLLLKY